MASGLILDYLGSGNVADRPATPDLYTGSLGLWFATDTEVLSLWDGATWTDVTGSAVTSVNGLTGTVVLALGDLDDVDAAAPSDGEVLAWNSADSEWQPSPPGGAPDAEQVSYDNTTSGLTATDVQAAIDELAASPGGGASTTQPDECISGLIVNPANGDYRIVVNAPHGGTITEVTTISASGTCTLTTKINTTALGGTANSVSSTEQSRAHASSNTFAAGDDIVLTVSSNSSCSKMTFTIKYTRTLA